MKANIVTPYFGHDSNARNNMKSRILLKKFGFEGYGRFFAILEILRESQDYSLDLSRPLVQNYLVEELRFDNYEETQGFLEYLASIELVDLTGKTLWCSGLNQRMTMMDEAKNRFSEAGKKSGESRRVPKLNNVEQRSNDVQQRSNKNEQRSTSFEQRSNENERRSTMNESMNQSINKKGGFADATSGEGDGEEEIADDVVPQNVKERFGIKAPSPAPAPYDKKKDPRYYDLAQGKPWVYDPWAEPKSPPRYGYEEMIRRECAWPLHTIIPEPYTERITDPSQIIPGCDKP